MTAIDKFEKKLQPAEDLIAGKLRNSINRKKTNTVEVCFFTPYFNQTTIIIYKYIMYI